ncbi:GNAT family N-acetyltransferase [Magnetovibrio sp.]|uniref:GNAT family N-acetyltransferase n=1 Tax=Magnetovibrio sp. TaxID=2024836 RepID=UPI002F939726
MQTRPYNPNDIIPIRDVFYQAVEITAARHYMAEHIKTWKDGANDLSRWRQRIETAAHCDIIEDELGIFAFGTLTNEGEIDLLMCHPRRAREGAASMILLDLERKARDMGLTRLFTQASLASRGTFYKSGFNETEQRVVLGMPCFGMEKVLCP